MTSNDSAIQTQDLCVKYKNFIALNNINFTAHQKEIIGILGPNGAGKTTLVDAIIGSCSPASGSVTTLGFNPISQAHLLRPHMGVVFQEAGFPPNMKVKDILYSWRNYIPHMTKEEVRDICAQVDILSFLNRSISSLSGGERRRIDIAIALYGHPQLLVLDEPTTGLDPVSRQAIWDIIKRQKEEGCTILLTSHYLEEIEYLADTIHILQHGKFTFSGTVQSLVTAAGLPKKCSVQFSHLLPAKEGVSQEDLAVQNGMQSDTQSDVRADVQSNVQDGMQSDVQSKNRLDSQSRNVIDILEPSNIAECRYQWTSHTPLEDMTQLVEFSQSHGNKITDISITSPSLADSYMHMLNKDRNRDRIKQSWMRQDLAKQDPVKRNSVKQNPVKQNSIEQILKKQIPIKQIPIN